MPRGRPRKNVAMQKTSKKISGKNHQTNAVKIVLEKLEIAKNRWREAVQQAKTIQREMRAKFKALKADYQKQLKKIKETAYARARAELLQGTIKSGKTVKKSGKKLKNSAVAAIRPVKNKAATKGKRGRPRKNSK